MRKLEDFVWIGRRNYLGGNDVSVVPKLRMNKKLYTGFTFRNDCFKKFAGGKEYFEVAFSGNRLYFRGCDAKDGYKISANNTVTNTTRYARIGEREDVTFVAWKGDYALRWDTDVNLWYIERKEEK